jgi:hypothetical protein
MFLDRAIPLRLYDVNRFEFQTVALRVLDQSCWAIEAHRLIIQHGRGECRKIVAFQKRTGVGDESKTRRMRFREAIQSKRGDGEDDLVLCFADDTLRCHPTAKFDFNLFHARFRTLEAQRAAKFFSFASGKARSNHGHAQKLFLKKRHTECAFKGRLQKWMECFYRLAS